MAVSAGAFPNIQRRAPVTVAADAPVLNIFQPVTEALFAYGLGNPVYSVVVGNKPVAHFGHFYKPAVAGVVYKGSTAAPAMGIAVLENGSVKKKSPLFQVTQHQLVCVLDKNSRPVGLGGHFALGVNKLNKGQTVFASHSGVILTESRSGVNNTGTVFHGDIIVCGYIPAFFGGRDESEQGLVFPALKVGALHLFKNFVLSLSQYLVGERLCQNIYFLFAAYFHINRIGVYAKRGV